jgi:prepilin-type N-terminal cleavage/methylation domain-containing protein
MSMSTARINKSSAFTLIELLVVISILSILSAILYRVIDVQGVRNRARDSTVITATEKMALAVESHVSAYGEAPDGLEFTRLIEGLTVVSGCFQDSYYCVFSIPSFDLSFSCSSIAGQSGTVRGTSPCNFFYRADTVSGDETSYAIVGKAYSSDNSWGRIDTLIGTQSVIGPIQCPYLGVPVNTDFSRCFSLTN